MKIEKPDYILTYKDDEETKNKVFNRVIKFFHDTELYSGECLGQSDEAYIEGIKLLIDLADKDIKFKLKWKE